MNKTIQFNFIALVLSSFFIVSCSDNIKNRYDNPTEIYLDELFNNWQD
ncbi:hypothetical protein KBJ98_02390 [Flavobacterium sp. F-328]|uniref:Uncharacterized protein n=1 Tax=Flavobacterium erciyesense TaxID=2825842 RepID=A0ABS5D0K6_9FLAO|nr:hypothetical protein [Flavobacterium erciyesense]MBQ0907545.1 hypothetical protein [Flavobacterium erciyesense]